MRLGEVQLEAQSAPGRARWEFVARWLFRCVALSILVSASTAQSHPLAPSLLEMREEAGGVYSVRWKTPSRRAAGVEIDPVLPAECRELEERSAQVAANYVEFHWRVSCGVDGVTGKTLAVSGLDRSRTTALIRVLFEDGRMAKGLVRSDAPEFQVVIGDGVAANYLRLGFEHILLGPDHLLFVLGLLLLIAGVRRLAGAITSFTLGHSLTLALAVLDGVHVSQQLVEVGIAISLVVVALELTRNDGTSASLLRSRPWLAAFGFGLLHGLGFAAALREAGLPADEVPFALLFFNVGIEVGQLAFIAVMIGLIALLQKRLMQRVWLERVSAYTIGSLAVFWVVERGAGLF
ncbi:MAG: HupE/UreJ family protein [Deltaproteobacteria bacterium]|nr:HupE/UreJ family protein [Deltaproteobacteria bacterium]